MAIEIAHRYADPAADSLVAASTRLHAAFADEDADVVLCSRDDVLFRVHSLVLRLASGWFRTLFTLPQSPPCKLAPPAPEVIHMVEPADVIAALLGMASGQELPPLDSFGFVEELLHAAEKFEMLGVLSILRLALCSPPLMEAHPIRVYGIACQWGWGEEAKIAAAKTIGIDLFSSSMDAVKDMSSVDSPHLTRLMLLHRRRREELKLALDSPAEFYANSTPGKCSHCQRELVHAGWLQLKYSWLAAIENSPAEVASGRILQRPELHEVLASACQHCQRNLYNPEVTINKLKTILDGLPTTVDFDWLPQKA